MFDRIQNLESVTGNSFFIIDGNLILNDEILPTIATHLLRPETEQLSQEAEMVMQRDINECVQMILDQVLENK